MGLSRLRWILAAAIGLLAMVSAIQALRTYLAADLTVGVLSVLALMITLLVGMGSLLWARRRIEMELDGLRNVRARAGAPAAPAGADLPAASDGADVPATPPSPAGAGKPAPFSVLLRDRRERLQAIRDAGVRPDRQVLADATAAEEAGRAYIGRYFVATTVLIGLVGTFAGLMATLSKVAPLLHEKEAGGLALLAGPLGGLHVTFGASLVAILATLALALAQGDLALHEEQALAALEDRTTHHLIPELWPPSEEPAERTVRAMADMKTLLAEAVAQSLEKSAARMAETARGEAERAARALEATASTVEKKISELGASVGGALEATATSVEKQLTLLGTSVGGVLQTSAGTVENQITQLYATVRSALESSAGAVEKQMTQLSATVGGALESSAGAVEKQMTQLSAMMGGALASNTGTVEKQMSHLSATVGGALESSAGTVEKQITQLSVSVIEALEAATQRQNAAMAEATRAAAAQASAAAEEAVRRSTALADEAVRTTTGELARTLQPMLAAEAERLELIKEAFGQSVAGIQQATERLAELQGVLEGTSRAQAAAIEGAGQAVVASFDKAVLGAGTALDAAAGKLAAAATDMTSGFASFGPRITALSTELSALGRELALQAARGPESDMGAVVLGELERIGAGLDRLAQLHRLGGGGAAALGAPPAAELGAAPSAESFGADATEETHS
jgi:hypothetical protein